MMTHDHSDAIAALAQERFQRTDAVKRPIEELLNRAMKTPSPVGGLRAEMYFKVSRRPRQAADSLPPF